MKKINFFLIFFMLILLGNSFALSNTFEGDVIIDGDIYDDDLNTLIIRTGGEEHLIMGVGSTANDYRSMDIGAGAGGLITIRDNINATGTLTVAGLDVDSTSLISLDTTNPLYMNTGMSMDLFAVEDVTIRSTSGQILMEGLVDMDGLLSLESLEGTYTGGSAYVCVYNNGTLFASDAACP